jgi:protein-S-isoprenylcysteine O-methyltransferase Ste14
MTTLTQKAFGGLFFLVIVLGVTLFLPAKTFQYWQAWVYIAVFAIASAAITIYLMKKDTALLQRRVNGGPPGEKQVVQKIIQSIAQLAFFVIFLVPAFDFRFKWSSVTVFAEILGDALTVAGFYIVFLVFKENTFASATIEVAAEQKVISTGPYSLVRHPMYSGALLLLISTPVALGSWWGMLAFAPIGSVILWRLLDEEKFLKTNLPGYTEYCSKVRFRLIPGIF